MAGGGGAAVGVRGMPGGGADGLHGDLEDAVAALLAALDGPVAPRGQLRDVAAAIAHALALDAAGDWLADGDVDSEDEKPILAEDFNAIVESFFGF